MELGVNVSEGCIEDGENVLWGYRPTVGVEFEDYGGGRGRIVVRGWGEVAGGVSRK